MSYIQFDNGMRIECEETVKAENGIIRMPKAVIKMGENTYYAEDVVIDLNAKEFSLPHANGERRTWSMEEVSPRRPSVTCTI